MFNCYLSFSRRFDSNVSSVSIRLQAEFSSDGNTNIIKPFSFRIDFGIWQFVVEELDWTANVPSAQIGSQGRIGGDGGRGGGQPS